MSREDFAGYHLVRPLGSGASGIVYLAEHGRLRRQVAIKILHAHLVGEPSEQRMLDEAHTLAMLHHPGIVEVFDVGVAEDGRAYVVMEHLEGEPLHARMRRAPLTEDRVVAFARQLASALEVAHGAGVVHRDLKPENVLVVGDPALPIGERVKLIDFGIAKREGRDRTATGVVLGTPAYMAPEQFLGSRHVDPRADVYSLGVLLYLMATGAPPFAGRDTGELLAEHAFCLPTPASELGKVSPRLSAIIERCLAKRPEDRFATMGELGAALRELETAPPASPFDDATTCVVPPPGMFGAEPVSRPIRVAPVRASSPTLPLPLPRPPATPPPPPPPPPRPARRSARWMLGLIATAGVAIALVHALRPGGAFEAAGAIELPVPEAPLPEAPASPPPPAAPPCASEPTPARTKKPAASRRPPRGSRCATPAPRAPS